MQTTTSIDAVRNDLNIYDLDADIAIGPTDVITFKCYHKKGATAVITKTITGVTSANGTFTVQLDPADTASLTITNSLGEVVNTRALYYEVNFDIGGLGKPQLIASGVMYLVG